MIISSGDVARPLADAREVLESYRSYGVVVEGWRESLEDSAQRLAVVSGEAPGFDLETLRTELENVAAHGLQNNEILIAKAADRLAFLVARVAIPGIPRPQDADWSFGNEATEH